MFSQVVHFEKLLYFSDQNIFYFNEIIFLRMKPGKENFSNFSKER